MCYSIIHPFPQFNAMSVCYFPVIILIDSANRGTSDVVLHLILPWVSHTSLYCECIFSSILSSTSPHAVLSPVSQWYIYGRTWLNKTSLPHSLLPYTTVSPPPFANWPEVQPLLEGELILLTDYVLYEVFLLWDFMTHPVTHTSVSQRVILVPLEARERNIGGEGGEDTWT
jgi:hypothetical protein